MGEGAQRNLPAFERRGIAAPLRDQRVGTFMTCCGQQEYHVFEESKRKLLGGHWCLSIACNAGDLVAGGFSDRAARYPRANSLVCPQRSGSTPRKPPRANGP